MFTKKVNADIENGNKLSDLRIRRNCGKLDSDVIAFCNAHLDAMADYLRMLAATNPITIAPQSSSSLDDTVAYLKSDPQKLLTMSKFMDAYDEVISWKLAKNDFLLDATRRHRELDVAMYSEMCTWDNGKQSAMISKLLYYYAHRNDSK